MKRTTEDAGKLLVRVTLAGLILFHGAHKLAYGISPIRDMLASHGVPGIAAYGVYIGEVVAPLLLLLGVYVRLTGLLVAGNMIVAVLLVHTSQFFTLTSAGGWSLELQFFYFASGLAVALLGAGRYSFAPPNKKWN
ncbi:MAG: DoxX family protein [Deltaproteobacteria bacterium]|nr:DoxX family protein [Deltaproteobacteria bacterium]